MGLDSFATNSIKQMLHLVDAKPSDGFFFVVSGLGLLVLRQTFRGMVPF
jgi:hypothetical protein